MGFQESLTSGQKSENLVLDIIKKKYPKAFLKEGYHKEYDIMIPEINKTVEVKKDFKSQYTGNVVIEVEMNNRPSGLETSTYACRLGQNAKREELRCLDRMNPLAFVMVRASSAASDGRR